MTNRSILRKPLTTRHAWAFGLIALWAGLVNTACTEHRTPVAPTTVNVGGSGALLVSGAAAESHLHGAAVAADKGYIDGWVNGEDVNLHYTKWFFCEEPPASGADSNCVIGAEPEVSPRPGPIRTIDAIAAVGFNPTPRRSRAVPGLPASIIPR